MHEFKVEGNGTWLCEHEDGEMRLHEHDLKGRPRFVVCPGCGTNWIVWKLYRLIKLATPVVRVR